MERWKAKVISESESQHDTNFTRDEENPFEDESINTTDHSFQLQYVVQRNRNNDYSVASDYRSKLTEAMIEDDIPQSVNSPNVTPKTNNKDDFMITLDLEDDQHENEHDLWLIVGDQYTTFSENQHGTVRQRKGLAVIASSAKKRDEYIQENTNNLPYGYTLKRITTLEHLKNDLNTIFPSKHKDKGISSSGIKKINSEQLNEIKRFELFRQIIQHEDDLLNQRVSWIILAQSFLMAAFITSTGPISLRYVTAIVGLATTIVAMPAIIAAGKNIEVQQQVYFDMVESDDRCQELHGHRRDYRKLDAEEGVRRKTFGHLLPTMAFRGKGAISILSTVVLLGAVQFFGWCLLLISLAASSKAV